MPYTLPKDEIEFLTRVHRRGQQGATQTDVAREESLASAGSLQGRVNRSGYKIVPTFELRDIRTGKLFIDQVADGEIVAHPEPEVAEVTVP